MSVPSQQSYPNLNPNGGNNLGGGSLDGVNANNNTTSAASGMKDSLMNTTQSAFNSVANGAQSLSNGPVAQKARDEANRTSNEFSNVANSRRVPDEKAATGQSLTLYHSMFYNILSWQNPRVTGIAYAAVITSIFFTRYVPILKYFFKASYIVLGVIAAAEIAGKLVFDKGLATQMRPRKYYTIPRQNLEAALEDVEQLINFFVIEAQRIVFAENVSATVSAFAAALVSYFLVKFVPKWGIAAIATSVVFFVPLIYTRNRELIDSQLSNAGTIINQQAVQMRDLAAQQTKRGGEIAKTTMSQYSTKAQEMVGQARSRASGTFGSHGSQPTSASSESIKKEDFPSAPSNSLPTQDRSAASTSNATENRPAASNPLATDNRSAASNPYAAQDSLAASTTVPIQNGLTPAEHASQPGFRVQPLPAQ